MPVLRDFPSITNECRLLWDCKGASFGRIHIMRPFALTHYAIGWVNLDIEVVNRKIKKLVDDRMDRI